MLCVEGIKQDFKHKYNVLRYKYLLNPQNSCLVPQADELFKENPSTEIAELYLWLLGMNDSKEGIHFIKEQRSFLDEVDMLMYYAKIGEYKSGYELCKDVLTLYSVDKFIASAIIECCINTGHFKEALAYAEEISEIEKEKTYTKSWVRCVFKKLRNTSEYRKQLIAKAVICPPFIDHCGYFGCAIHDTNWI